MSLLDAEPLKTVDRLTYQGRREGFLRRDALQPGQHYIGRLILESPTDEAYASDFLVALHEISVPKRGFFSFFNITRDLVYASISHVSADGRPLKETHELVVDAGGRLTNQNLVTDLRHGSMALIHHEVGYLRSPFDERDRELAEMLTRGTDGPSPVPLPPPVPNFDRPFATV
jgi:hypothetical protein